MDNKNTKLILLRETWIESAKRDAFAVVCAFAMIFPGWLLDSGALSFIGSLMLIIVVVGRASGLRKKYEMTPAEALEEIKKIMSEGQ